MTLGAATLPLARYSGRGQGEGLDPAPNTCRMFPRMRPERDPDSRLRGFARRMRHESTDAERRLWSILRGRRLSGFKFRRQHPMAGYILDFYCVACALAIELDGGQHCDPQAEGYDRMRSAELAERGVQVLRFPDDQLLKDPQAIAEEIYNHLVCRLPSPPPSPGVPGEGESLA